MTINADTTLRELAFEVCTALERAGTTAVLSLEVIAEPSPHEDSCRRHELLEGPGQ